MSELSADLIRRVLCVFHFDGTEGLWWRLSNDRTELRFFAQCSDFFGWGCADCEPIETEADVALLEQAHAELQQATSCEFPMWTGELYAARRRNAAPAAFMLGDGKHAMKKQVQALFPVPEDKTMSEGDN